MTPTWAFLLGYSLGAVMVLILGRMAMRSPVLGPHDDDGEPDSFEEYTLFRMRDGDVLWGDVREFAGQIHSVRFAPEIEHMLQ